MKNLTNFDEDCFNIHKTAVKNKNNSALKKALISIEDKVRGQYEVYNDKFTTKSIYKIKSISFTLFERDSLIDLYSYRSAIIKSVKNKILDKQIITINATCQYCTINSVGTLDHFIPKEEFPEFSVNPLNLFPCCSECNSKKSKFSFDGEESLFINLYLDELPEKEYLKAKFVFNDDVPMVTFTLANDEMINEELFNTISNHYKRLNLLERMRAVSNERITDIINSIKRSFKINNDINTLKKFIIEEEMENKSSYGYNHWKSVLVLSLISYNDFWNKYITNN